MKKEKINLYVTKEEKDEIEKYAENENRTTTNFVCNVLKKYIEAQKNKT